MLDHPAHEKINNVGKPNSILKIPDKLFFKEITRINLQFVSPGIPWPYMSMINEKSMPWEKIPMIVAEKGMARKRTDAWFRSRNIKPNIFAKVSGNETILAMVSLGFGIGIVPKLVIEKNIINRDVKVLNIKPEIKPYSAGICVQKRRVKNPLISAFWGTIQDSLS